MTARIIAAVAVGLWARPALSGAMQFVEVSNQRGIGAYQSEDGHGSGLAADDYDGDGDVDFFAPQAEGQPYLLYRNLGNGFFEEMAARVGLGSVASGRAALWLDYDGDGDQDLLVANDDVCVFGDGCCWPGNVCCDADLPDCGTNADSDCPGPPCDPAAFSSFTLYRQNSAGLFEDVTAEAGLFKPPLVMFFTHHWSALCAGDINNDGWLDIYTAQFPLGPGHLFLNQGNGAFQDISASSGVAECDVQIPVNDPECRSIHQCVMADFNADGWTDIYAAVDVGPGGGNPNVLWINQHDNSFVDQAAQAGLDNAMDDMGITLGDYDNDGDLDVYVTNIFGPGEHNVLFRNDSAGAVMAYTEVSQALGVDNGGYGWGATFFDADLDGDLDLAATNGWRSGVWVSDTSRFFTNQQAGLQPFTDQSAAVQFNDTHWGSALVAADFDRDGDQDLLQTCMTFYDVKTGDPTQAGPLRLLDNTAGKPGPTGPHYLVVQPRQPGPNRRAIGAIVRVESGGRTMMRLISAGTSYMGQEPAEAFFGLGPAAVAETVTVEWPDGSTSTIENVAADQILTIQHCAEFSDCADLDGDGLRDDNCLWWACPDGACHSTNIVFADMGGFNGSCPADGAADGNDRFHALNCFSNVNTTGGPGFPCEAQPPAAFNVDAGGPFGSCSSDGVCDGNDAFHALNAFSGVNTCTCPANGGPAPAAEAVRKSAPPVRTSRRTRPLPAP